MHFVPLEQVTEEHIHKQFDVNVLGLLLATQEAIKHFDSEWRQHHQHRFTGQLSDTADSGRL